MRKATIIHYDSVDVQKIVRNELDNARVAWLDEFTKIVLKFKDDVMTKLDKVMGELETIREEQALTSGRLSKHTDKISELDKRLEKFEHTFA